MKNKIIILIGAAMIMAFTACESKDDSTTNDAYVGLEASAISVAEDAGTLNLRVQAYSPDGNPQVTVSFGVTDGEGAQNGVDYWIESPEDNTLEFNGTTTQNITIGISDANVGTYTGPKQFTVTILSISNGYSYGAVYSTTVTITDVDREPTEGAPDVTGTYQAAGIGREMSGFDIIDGVFTITYDPIDKTWDFVVFQDPDDPEKYYVSGVVDYVSTDYTWGDYSYLAYAFLSDDGTQLIIPSQTIVVAEDDSDEDGMFEPYSTTDYYYAYIPCTGFDEETGEFSYGDSFDNITFTYNEEDGTWVSDYGFAFVSCDSDNVASYDMLLDICAPGVVITKTE